jgi:hypothetical protein
MANNKNKNITRKVGAHRARGAFGASSTALVPYNQEPMTDSLRLPRAVGTIYPTTKSYVIEGWLTQSASATAQVAPVFTVASLISDFSSLAAVFDQYRVVAIECKAIPRVNSATGSSATAMSGQLYTVLDFDDNTIVNSVAAITAYDNCVATPLIRSIAGASTPGLHLPRMVAAHLPHMRMLHRHG